MTTENLPLAGKKLLLLDGSRKAIEIVEQAQRLGLHVVVTDYNSAEDSPAKLTANEHFNVSTSDLEAVVELVRRENISGIVTGFSDRWLPRYAEICKAAGLPCYATVDQIRLFTDKKRYKQLMVDFGVPTIEGFTVEEATSGVIPKSSFPLMIKPADGSGSRGISVVHAPDELEDGIAVARGYSWTDELVIERYLPGEEATVYWVFQDGEYHVSMLWNRHMLSFGDDGRYRLPVAYTGPSYLITRYLAEVAPRVKDMLRSVGIRNGMMFMQGLIDRGTFHTYDIGYRITPTQEYRIIEQQCGYNPLSMLLNFAVTGSMGEPELATKASPAFPGFGYNVSTLIAPGTIGSFHGLAEVAALPGVLSVSTAMSEGETLPAEGLGQLRQVVVRTIGTTTTQDELEQTINTIVSTIDVRDADGASMTLPGLPVGSLRDRMLE